MELWALRHRLEPRAWKMQHSHARTIISWYVDIEHRATRKHVSPWGCYWLCLAV